MRTLLAIAIVGALALGSMSASAATATSGHAIATFAGGCFWCMEPPFDELDGVISTTSGYTGGHKPNPTYEEVSSGATGHTEAVQVVFDPQRINYEKLLAVFWRNIDRSTGRAFSTTTRSNDDLPTNPSAPWRPPGDSRCPSSRRSSRLDPSTLPRSTTRITTRRTQSATSSTGRDVGGTSGWPNCGGTPRRAASERDTAEGFSDLFRMSIR
jgi:hypothetical protein